MKGCRYFKEKVFFLVISVVSGFFIGISLYNDRNNNAEAVGAGNLSGYDQNGNYDPNILQYHKHNLSSSATHNGPRARRTSEGGGGTTQICVFCHTPHRAIANTGGPGDYPLWNHQLSAVANYSVKQATPTTFVYNDSAMIGNVRLLSQPLDPPDGSSKLCLSCHDGTVAIGNVVNLAGVETIIAMTGPLGSIGNISAGGRNFGKDLTKHHVVSVPMNDQLKTASFANCSSGTPPSTIYVKYPWNLPNAQSDKVLLKPTGATYAGNPGIDGSDAQIPSPIYYKSGYKYGVQCPTCHDPHKWSKRAGATNSCNFLVAGCANKYDGVNDISALCRACHEPCP